MAQNTAPERPVLVPGETRNFAVSFGDVVDSGELLTGTPTVAEETTSDLTIANKAVNTAALTINGKSVAIGQAVQFKVSGQLATGTVRGDESIATGNYEIKITVSTDATPAQTLIKYVQFDVAEE